MLTDAEREGRRPHARLITCARCGAKPGKPCRTRTGARATAAHAVRTEGLWVWWAGWDARKAEET